MLDQHLPFAFSGILHSLTDKVRWYHTCDSSFDYTRVYIESFYPRYEKDHGLFIFIFPGVHNVRTLDLSYSRYRSRPYYRDIGWYSVHHSNGIFKTIEKMRIQFQLSSSFILLRDNMIAIATTNEETVIISMFLRKLSSRKDCS